MKSIEKQIRIFISSTFRDMHSERDVLVKKVFPKIREKLIPYGYQLIDIDLRWGVTAEQTENDKAIEFCLQSIDQCRPFFVGILGERYGWIPNKIPSEVLNNYPGIKLDDNTSITAMEIIHGVLNEDRQNAVFFFRDKSFEDSIPEGLDSIVKSESGIHQSKQNDLKQKIRDVSLVYPLIENYPCHFEGLQIDWDLIDESAPEHIRKYVESELHNNFISAQSLQQADQETKLWLKDNANLTLGGLEEFANQMYSAVWTMLCNSYPELSQPITDDITDIEKENKAHKDYATDLNNRFGGRLEIIDNFNKVKNGNLLVYSGPAGCGKSSILAKLYIDSIEDNDFTSICHFTGASDQSKVKEKFLQRLDRMLSKVSDLGISHDNTPDTLVQEIKSKIKTIDKNKHLTIFIDDLDLIYEESGFDLRWIPSTLPNNITIVLSVLNDKKWSEQNLKRLIHLGAKTIDIPAFNKSERQELIGHIPTLWAKTLDEKQINLLSNHPATNNPLFLTLALEELRMFGSYERLELKINKLPAKPGKPGLIALYKQFISRLERDLGLDVVKDPLCLLATSKFGLSEIEINVLCQIIPEEELAHLWRELRSHILISEGRLSFYHDTLKEAISEHYLTDHKLKHQFHQRLASLFSDLTDKKRALPELLYHYHILERNEKIKELLKDLKNFVFLRQEYPELLNMAWTWADIDRPAEFMHNSLCENLNRYNEILNNNEGIALQFWQPSSDGKQINLFSPDTEIKLECKLTPWQQDLIMELCYLVMESNVRNANNFLLAGKCLAIMESELGPVHARTLDVLSVALSQFEDMLQDSMVFEYYSRALLNATAYLPMNHPASLRIRMNLQLYFYKNKEEVDLESYYKELLESYNTESECEYLQELEQDIPLRTYQRKKVFAYATIIHSQLHREAGNIGLCKQYCEEALKYCEAELGNTHEYTIMALNNLAMYYIDIKHDIDKGKTMLEEAVQYIDIALGYQTSISISMLNNLATLYGNSGQFEKGLPFYKDTIQRKIAYYGDKNPSTLHSKYNLAFCYWNLQQYDKALDICRETIAAWSEYGDKYENERLLIEFHETEIMEEAGMPEVYDVFLERYEKIMDKMDKSIWLPLFLYNKKMAEWTIETGEKEHAFEIYRYIFEFILEIPEAKDQALSFFMSMKEYLDEQIKEARENKDTQMLIQNFDTLLEISRLIYDEKDPELIRTLSNYGKILNEMEMFEKAEEILTPCTSILEEVLGKDHPETRTVTSMLATAMMNLGKTEESGKMMMESMQAGASRKNDTLSMLQRIIEEKESKQGFSHPDTIKTYEESSEIILEEGQIETAIQFLEAAIKGSEQHYGPLNNEHMLLEYKLADLLYTQEEFSKAEVILRRISENYTKNNGIADENSLKIMNLFGEVLMTLNENAESLAIYQKALKGYLVKYDKFSHQTLDAKARIFNLYSKLDMKKEAGKAYEEFDKLIRKGLKDSFFKDLYTEYIEKRNSMIEARIGSAINVIKSQQAEGRMEYIGDDPEKLIDAANSMTQRDLDPRAPEGSEIVENWCNVLNWLIPNDDSLKYWEQFCEKFESIVKEDDLCRFIPRYRLAQWLMMYEAENKAYHNFGKIWQYGEAESWHVQSSAVRLISIAAPQMEEEDIQESVVNIVNTMAEQLGTDNQQTHMILIEIADILYKENKAGLAKQLYELLLEFTKDALPESHPFKMGIMERLNRFE